MFSALGSSECSAYLNPDGTALLCLASRQSPPIAHSTIQQYDEMEAPDHPNQAHLSPSYFGPQKPYIILSWRIESSWRRMWDLASWTLTNNSRYKVSMTIMAGIRENQKSPVRSFSLVAVMIW